MTEYKVFIDTNIWVYSFIEENVRKRNFILGFLEDILNKAVIIVSIQVINEFHYVCLKKYKLKDSEIYKFVKDIKSIAKVVPINFTVYKTSFELRKKYNFSFWDSLIVASTLKNNCKILFSEDMQDGFQINDLTIKNPLKEFKGE